MGKHFVLVHGACHGAWSWYKLKALLEAAGHKVTALDLAASGIDSRKIEQVKTLHEYTLPLMEFMESVPQDEKVILVGHSLGGLSIGLAMEKFPQKISFGVFLTAFMPSPAHKSSYVLDKFNEQTGEGYWLDTQFLPYGTPEEPRTSMFFGPKFLAKLYHLSSPEDVALALSLVRPSSLFVEDVSKAKYFTAEGYGSVKRVYIKCTEDEAIPLDFQIWLIDNVGVHEAKEVTGADHMPMLCMPIQLCDKLLEVADACN